MNGLGDISRPGFYETFRTSGGRPHHWRYNLARLQHACARAGIALPSSFMATNPDRMHAVIRQLLRDFEVEDAVFRYAIAFGADPSVPPAFRVERERSGPSEELAARPLPLPAPPAGIAVRVLQVARDPGESPPRPKSLNDATLRQASEEIHARAVVGSDEGLLLSREARLVVETSRQNIFWIVNDTIHYPDPALGPVAGTCLAWILDGGLPARSARASLDELVAADAVAVCNSVRGITPVAEIWSADDRSRLRELSSAAHPILTRLSAAWRESLAATRASASIP